MSSVSEETTQIWKCGSVPDEGHGGLEKNKMVQCTKRVETLRKGRTKPPRGNT